MILHKTGLRRRQFTAARLFLQMIVNRLALSNFLRFHQCSAGNNRIISRFNGSVCRRIFAVSILLDAFFAAQCLQNILIYGDTALWFKAVTALVVKFNQFVGSFKTAAVNFYRFVSRCCCNGNRSFVGFFPVFTSGSLCSPLKS